MPVVSHEPGLRWSIKRSFLRYVRSMADGRCSATDGASPAEPDAFLFSGDASDPAGRNAVVRFRGDVRFAGHHGLLFVRICDPWLHMSDGTARLSIIDPDPDGQGGRLAFATFRHQRAVADPYGTAIQGTDVRLTDAGAALFFGVYAPDEPFDDFVARY